MKPWAVDVVKERLKEVEAVHPFAFAMDIDSAGLPHAGLANPPMLLKTEEELREIAAATDLPFIVKGIMTAEAAQKALRAGAYAIVVSNHGGRVMIMGFRQQRCCLKFVRQSARIQKYCQTVVCVGMMFANACPWRGRGADWQTLCNCGLRRRCGRRAVVYGKAESGADGCHDDDKLQKLAGNHER